MTVHQFTPSHYHTTIGPHEPVLTIASGDHVITTTVDARGYDQSGKQVTAPGNPQTGPFFVEGAEPGDILAVSIHHLQPNRPRGWTATLLAANVVDPPVVRQLPTSTDIASWEIHPATHTAHLISEQNQYRQLTVPLQPMLGCFGVAPAGGQAISTATSGPHGGNMDYRHFGTGARILFPVFVPGALFHLGDGHAAQGDGEIVGTGIEISMDVEFSVQVIKRSRPISWPRAYINGFHCTIGNARPLDQALQHATTELFHWLLEDGFNPHEASLLLGQAITYDIGNVFDPAYTVVAKLHEQFLAT